VASPDTDVADGDIIKRPFRQEFLSGAQEPLEGLQGPVLLIAAMPLRNSFDLRRIAIGTLDGAGFFGCACH
jgi:hypothetical protein